MFNIRTTAFITAFMLLGVFADTCKAGPLLDWLRGVRSNPYRYNTFYRGPAVQTQAYSQMPGTCTTTCPKTYYQTVNRVVANYVPYTAFRTEWYRVPVTYYRPVTTTNPQTGCITTCQKPCTYYQMQARRVPYTTYQTVYRTVQHRVPYTVYETSYGPNCSSCSSCSTCGVNGGPAAAAPGVVQSGTVPSYGLNPNTQYAPANTVPQLAPGSIQPDASMQKPVSPPIQPQVDPEANKDNTSNSSHSQPQLNFPANPAPVVDNSNVTASLIRRKWDYSPVRVAAYVSSGVYGASHDSAENDSTRAQVHNFGRLTKPSQPAFRSSGWKSAK